MIAAGQVLNGRYKLLRPLGQGSQAFVWVAEHLALGSQVAVKLIDPELAKQEDARERFAREATAAAKLRSAHVVHILDHGIEADQPFIVMELLEGEDLFDRLERRKKLTLAETSKIITQVARALMRAHAEGIIHRDLKPENVFLTRNEDDELAKVLDFGVAKVTTPAKAVMVRTGVGTLIGTPHYMSPEQVKGLTEIDHRSDLWSLGVITYQCVTGQLPFDSEGVGDLLIRITMSQPAIPSSLNPDLPPAFDAWFKKACAKDPDDRFETSREMADALAKVIGAPQPPVSQPGRVLVNLADSPDLDWGSLAGVRIPIPPRKSAPPPSNGEASDTASPSSRKGSPGAPASPRLGARLASRLPTLDAPEEEAEIVEIVEAGRSIPPPSVPPPGASLQSSASAAPVSESAPASQRTPPPASVRSSPVSSSSAAVPPAFDSSNSGASNPFLEPIPPSRRMPSSGRGLQSTVTGLASNHQPSLEFEPELENPRRRRATWIVAMGIAAAAIGITVGVIRSRGGFDELTGNAGAAPKTEATQSASNSREPAKPVLGSPPPVLASSGSASSSAEAFDPMVTKKPTKPSAAPVLQRPFKRPDEDGVLVLPTPEREVPAH
ncbi:MAG: serine/threonine protein kinase [Polyangiaceae bacterium]|nr:serine/threonine protein kinase [Polyangiaceae bacterium]